MKRQPHHKNYRDRFFSSIFVLVFLHLISYWKGVRVDLIALIVALYLTQIRILWTFLKTIPNYLLCQNYIADFLQVPRSSPNVLPAVPRSAVVHPPAAVPSSELLHSDFSVEGRAAGLFNQRIESSHGVEQGRSEVVINASEFFNRLEKCFEKWPTSEKSTQILLESWCFNSRPFILVSFVLLNIIVVSGWRKSSCQSPLWLFGEFL